MPQMNQQINAGAGLAETFRKKEGVDLRQDPMALQRLKEAAEKKKKKK